MESFIHEFTACIKAKAEFSTQENEDSISYMLEEDLNDAGGWDIEHIKVNMKENSLNDREIGFTQGVAWACALMARNGKIDPDQIWRESNMPEEDLDLCDPADAEIIRNLLHSE
jgi:hypothetical protein